MFVPAASLDTRSVELSRRDFVRSCSIIALSLSGCAPGAARARYTHHLLADPAAAEYLPTLRAVIPAVLPFEHPRFPGITPREVESRLSDLFPLESEALQAVRRSLVLFDDVPLFARAWGPIADIERRHIEREGELDEEGTERELDRRRMLDERELEAFTANGAATSFRSLSVDRRRDYLGLWSQSGFRAKRQFYRALKGLVVISAYSEERLWTAIRYGGPLLGRDA